MTAASFLADGPPSLAARWLVTVACASMAAIALFSGLDRMAERRPGAAAWVPGPLAAQANLARARQALAGADGTAALQYARAGLDASPLDPAAPATLGAARLALGQSRQAEAAFRVAGKLGWRIFTTQAYWLDRALAAGDFRVAALRLDALVRQDPALLRRSELLVPFEQSEQGRIALARQMKNAPWRLAYATDIEAIGPAAVQRRAAVLGEVAQGGTALGCEAAAPIASALLASHTVSASILWRQHCPMARRSLVYDGDFAAASLGTDGNAFAWSFPGESDVSVILTAADAKGSRGLAIDSTAQRQTVIARQRLVIPVGSYRLSWRAVNNDGSASPALLPLVYCHGQAETVITGQLDRSSGRWSAPVSIRDGCQSWWLAFAVGPRPARATLSSVALDAVR